MIPVELKLDVFTELERVCDFQYELFIVDKTMEELEKLAQRAGKQGQNARIAKQICDSKNLKVIETEEGYADDLIVSIAEQKGYYVATQDADLKRKLRDKNLSVVFLRQKNYIVVEK